MRKSQVRLVITGVAALLLAAMIPAFLFAQDHIVKSGELHQALVSSSQQRLNNINKIESFLASKSAQQALKATGIKPGKISQAVSMLDDDELARLASRAAEIQADFAAGADVDRTMLYIIPVVAVGSLVALLVAMP